MHRRMGLDVQRERSYRASAVPDTRARAGRFR